MLDKFPYVVGHISCEGDRTRFTTEEAASKFIGEVIGLVDPAGVLRGDYYIDGPYDDEAFERDIRKIAQSTGSQEAIDFAEKLLASNSKGNL